jgi:hypothetical protein
MLATCPRNQQPAEGGLVLWVSLRDDDAERRALHILTNAGGRDVHVHEFEREWTLKDRPLSDVQFDPFLWWPPGTPRETRELLHFNQQAINSGHHGSVSVLADTGHSLQIVARRKSLHVCNARKLTKSQGLGACHEGSQR